MSKQSFTEDDFLKEIPQEELKEEIANIIDKYGTSRIMTRIARLLIAEKIVEFIEHKASTSPA
jgi:16S rRNA C1402 N4-methylase RsmH